MGHHRAMVMATAEHPPVSNRQFRWICIGGYLLSIPYGSTFLLALLVAQRGGNEGDAGAVIFTAAISTLLAVLLSGHWGDVLGAPRAVACSSLLLASSCIGFGAGTGVGPTLIGCGFLLGWGWGTFYTLGPMIVATVIDPTRRIRFFALLSGSMMSGIGTAPLLGRLFSKLGWPLESAYWVAAVTSVLGGVIFFLLHGWLDWPRYLVISSRISLTSVRRVLESKASYPIIMVGLGGALFGALSSFQSSYAQAQKLDYAIFFVGFMSAVIFGRLFLSGIVTRRNPYVMTAMLTGIVVVSLLLFLFWVTESWSYFFASATLGTGYGLTYSVINGLAANEAPPKETSQSLLLFTLSYFVGVLGFPLIAGRLVSRAGVRTLLFVILAIATTNWVLALVRLRESRRTS